MNWKLIFKVASILGGLIAMIFLTRAFKEQTRKMEDRDKERRSTEAAWRQRMSNIVKEEATRARDEVDRQFAEQAVEFEGRLESVCLDLKGDLEEHANKLKKSFGT